MEYVYKLTTTIKNDGDNFSTITAVYDSFDTAVNSLRKHLKLFEQDYKADESNSFINSIAQTATAILNVGYNQIRMTIIREEKQ